MPVVDEETTVDFPTFDEVFPASVTITRTAEADFKSRQLIVWIDGMRVATLLWGDSITYDVEPGAHRIRVSNTLVWKTAEFTALPGERVCFEAISRMGPGSIWMTMLLGVGPLYVTLKRMI